jgi:hypothetical protein
MLNGDAHHSSEGELRLRIRPADLVFKDRNARMIAEGGKTPHRILYVGVDITLAGRLTDALPGYRVVRSPVGSPATLLIRSEIKYSLLLFDDEQAEELGSLARSLKHREHTPVVACKEAEGFGKLVSNIRRKLAGL